MNKSDRIPYESSLASNLLSSFELNRYREAIRFKHISYRYEEILYHAKNIAVMLQDTNEERILILSSRHVGSYVGIFGVILSGRAYIFLNTKDNLDRLIDAINCSKSTTLLVDENNLTMANHINHQLQYRLTIVRLSLNSYSNSFVSPKSAYQYAYIMFTSGTSGKPKGVAISHINILSFLKNIISRMNVNVESVFSHISELTFDVSVHDIFSCWMVGACLCVLPENYIYRLEDYIQVNEISHWASVPSVVALLQQFRRLRENIFPSLRYSIFCGEPLPLSLTKLWSIAAPNSVIDNLYGPTEATVFITGFRWNSFVNEKLIPIGWPFKGQRACLVDDEIVLSGSQVVKEYWNNTTIDRDKFITINGVKNYRTGDLGQWHPNYGLIFKGRVDDQFKIRGYRVERSEIQIRIQEIALTSHVAVLPIKEEKIKKIFGFICFIGKTDCTIEELKMKCRSELPDYMCPSKFIQLNHFPLNKNGKIDYKFLESLYHSLDGLS
ncbi:MAG: hypothetical protein A3F10_00370 [Coxiella sp. RIFCSPHIGHO2_12_FULL_42_15]|nr:MAG: hypothetical protein A3F10_00370 [Coxiella sp. RIFCSPHIGHO2_12_FULL_42_15]